VIRLGLRLTITGGKEAVGRLLLIALATAVGIGFLLTILSGMNAVTRQNSRYAWLETGYSGSNAPGLSAPPAPPGPSSAVSASDPLWWLLQADYFRGKLIGRVDVAATGPNSPVPPGIFALPGPGQFYVSPGLAKLLKATPAAELGARFPGVQIGTIGSAALPAPNSLIVIVGRSVGDLSRQPDAALVSSISTTVPSSCTGHCAYGVGTNHRGIILILSVVAAGLLFPIMIFIGGATRLSAARREQRFAAMRLVGATPRQVSTISTVESGVAAFIGVAIGFALFYAMRPVLAAIPFNGDPFFSGDLTLKPIELIIVALGVPLVAAVAARLALRRVNISPLGVSRHVTPPAPSPWRLIPLMAGVTELAYLAYFSHISRSGSSTEQAIAYLGGILVMMAGLVAAGPWLTMVTARLAARRAKRPSTLIAARRLADNPQAGFRAIRGLVLAVFIGTCALGVITTVVAYDGGSVGATAITNGTLIDEFDLQAQFVTSVPDATMTKLRSIDGVTGITLLRAVLTRDPASSGPEVLSGPPQIVASCAQLIETPALGRCVAGADVVSLDRDFGGAIRRSPMSERSWGPADISASQLETLPIDTIVVATNGSVATVERARSALEAGISRREPPMTLTEVQSNSTAKITAYRQLADVVILTSLVLAGCGLAVSVAGGLTERKRPFSLLRLSGAPLRVLRRVVALETAAPLLITAFVSAAAGLVAAQLFLRAQLQETMQAPSLQYYVILGVGLAASLAVIASTFPLLTRVTGAETARSE
jgi:hypothetical protein